jgi:lysophospholipase L1-like esterase
LGFAEGRKANYVLSVASVLATLFVLLLVYEVTANVRYYRWRRRFDSGGWMGRLTVASPDPALIWEYRPYGDADGIATNRWGFRDVDYPTAAKPSGVRRIAFLGDSVTLGMGVEPEETFVRLVGTMAAGKGHDVQTLNFAVDGYNALQIRALLTARVLAFEPDEVVYVMCLNDFDFQDSSGRKIAYFRRPWLFFPQDLERRYRALRGVEYHHGHFRENKTRVFRAVLEMRDVLAARGAGFLLVTVPVFPERQGDPAYFAHYPLLDLHQEVGRFCRTSGIRSHNLLDDFRRQGHSPERDAFDVWHLSAEGHRLVAEGLLPFVVPEPERGYADRP